MLKRVYNLKSETQLFLDMKGYAFPHFGNKERMCDFGFLIDMTQNLNDLNMELQDKGQFIHNLHDKIQGFERKSKLWKQHFLQNNVSHFPHLEKENVITSMKMFSSAFNIDVDTVPEDFQIEEHAK